MIYINILIRINMCRGDGNGSETDGFVQLGISSIQKPRASNVHQTFNHQPSRFEVHIGIYVKCS